MYHSSFSLGTIEGWGLANLTPLSIATSETATKEAKDHSVPSPRTVQTIVPIPIYDTVHVCMCTWVVRVCVCVCVCVCMCLYLCVYVYMYSPLEHAEPFRQDGVHVLLHITPGYIGGGLTGEGRVWWWWYHWEERYYNLANKYNNYLIIYVTYHD